MTKKHEEFNTAMRVNKKLTCDNCAHSWVSTAKPQQIKQGMIVIEDVCPSCQEYISVAL